MVKVKLPRIEKFITKDGSVRASAVVSTPVIQEMQITHNTFPTASAALGRAITGAALLANFLKEKSKLALHFKGDGPLGQVFAEADSEGMVRGFITNPHVQLASKNGKLDVGTGVGKGFLSVATYLPNHKQPYSGSVEIQTGEIGDDIAFYLYQSQQISSIVALGVYFENKVAVAGAGGVIVQLLPGASEKIISTLEERVKKMKSISDLLKSDATATDLVSEILEDFEFIKLDQSVEMKYSCQCSQAKVENALLLMGSDEIKNLIEKDEPANVSCDFCGRKYSVTKQRLKKLFLRSS